MCAALSVCGHPPVLFLSRWRICYTPIKEALRHGLCIEKPLMSEKWLVYF